VIPTQNIWFDDSATLAMGQAFDRACKSLRNFGSAVPAIIADLIIAAAKNGERNPGRLYERVLNHYGIDDMSMLAGGVGRDYLPAYTSVGTQRDLRVPRFTPLNRAFFF
jgi:hypothetical protein